MDLYRMNGKFRFGFWSSVAWPPTFLIKLMCCTWAFPLCILVLYRENWYHHLCLKKVSPPPFPNELPVSIRPPTPLPNGLEINKPLGGLIGDLWCAFLLQSSGGSLWGFWWVTEGVSDVGFCVTMAWLQLTLSLQGRLAVPSIQGL